MGQDTGRKQSAAVDALLQLFMDGYELPTSENKIKTPEELKKHRIDDVKEILNGCGGLNEYWFIRFFGQIFEITENAIDEAFRVGAMPEPESDTVDEIMLSFIKRAQRHETSVQRIGARKSRQIKYEQRIENIVRPLFDSFKEGDLSYKNAKGVDKKYGDRGARDAFIKDVAEEEAFSESSIAKRYDKWSKE